MRNRKTILSERGVWEAKITEEMVIKEIVTRLSYAGAFVNRIVERIPWGRTTSTPGTPDLYCYFPKPTRVHPGLVFPLQFWLEVKRPGGKRRPAQIAWIEARKADGVIAGFCESWENVIALLKEYGVEL